MYSFLSAGFGDLLPAEDLALIRDLGYSGIRQDVKAAHGYEYVADLVSNALAFMESRAIFVVNALVAQELAQRVAVATKASAVGSRCIVEVGNEADADRYWGVNPEDYGKLVADTVAMTLRTDPQLTVISGGITSTSKEALKWLRTVVNYLPSTCGIGFHTYRSGPPNEPLEGFRSRGDEFSELREVANGRDLYNTEFGWSTKLRPKPFPLCWQKKSLSDGTVAAYLFSEIAINRANGVKTVCVYQLNDPPTGPDFGIRYNDGTLKPQSQVLL